MKKILALILAALMVLTMVACAAKAEPAKEAEQTTTTEPAEETTPEQTAPAEETGLPDRRAVKAQDCAGRCGRGAPARGDPARHPVRR